MSYFQDFPNTNFYNQDLGWLIKKYKELNGDIKILQQIYDKFKEQIKDITIEQLQEWLDDGTLTDIIEQTYNQFLPYVAKDVVVLSEYEKDNQNMTKRLQNAINYTSTNKLKLYVDMDVLIDNTIYLKPYTHLISNRFKFKIYTETGISLNGLTMFMAYEQDNIIIDNVRFENTGYGSGGSTGTLGRFDGFGNAVALGGCDNVTVKNCHFFKCGGYNHQEGNGMLWLSLCTNSLVKDCIFELGDNGIEIDRWYANINPNKQNNGVIVDRCFFKTLSGRGIVIENNTADKIGNIICTNNVMYDFYVTGFEGRCFAQTMLVNNIIDGNINLRVNPMQKYGLTEIGWDWSKYMLDEPQFGFQLINGPNTPLINNNIINNVNMGIFIGNIENGNIQDNQFKDCNYGINISNKENDCDNLICTGNSIKGTNGITMNFNDKRIKSLLINSNILLMSSGYAINLLHISNFSIKDNVIAGSNPQESIHAIKLQYCDDGYCDNQVNGRFRSGIDIENGNRIQSFMKTNNCINVQRLRNTAKVLLLSYGFGYTDRNNTDGTVTEMTEISTTGG